MFHDPVLLSQVLDAARGAQRVVDGTLGDGGHAEALRAAGAELLCIDRDPDAIRIARERLGSEQIRYLEASYADSPALEAIRRFQPDFILLDLGLSSRQLDQAERGFTFRPGAPLDMRMGSQEYTAADLLNQASAEELADWFFELADERRSRRLAGEIVRRRERQEFLVSDDLVNAIRAVLGSQAGPDDFARIFQAVRIVVNEELSGLTAALPELRDALIPGGALAIISYHSGEDRVVKHAFREWSRSCVCPKALPVCTCRGRSLGTEIARGGTVPDAEEIAHNPRARSARLRIFRVSGKNERKEATA
jgi:16S rRNA (cytosine1402-N4)-methyltransferase